MIDWARNQFLKELPVIPVNNIVLLTGYCFCALKSSVDFNPLDTVSYEFIVKLLLLFLVDMLLV